LFLSKNFVSPQPKVFQLLSALTPKEHSIEIIQTINPNEIDYDVDYDLIGISCLTCYANIAYDISKEFRRRGKTVVLGGYHPTALPDEAKQHSNSVVIGEVEEVWNLLLKDMENSKLKPFYKSEKPVDLCKVPFKENIESMEKNFEIFATRGCPHGCEYCAITNSYLGNIFRKRPVDVVIEEIEMHVDNQFIFHDASLTIDLDYSKQLFTRLKDLNKIFFASGNINTLGKDEEFLKLARDAGCFAWFIGFESINQESLDSINKNTNRVEDYKKAIKKIRDYGIAVFGSFMFGFDQDDKTIFDSTYEFIKSSDIDILYFHKLTPFPGTPIYRKLESENRILTKDWSKYDLDHIVFQPKQMTPEELLDGVHNLHTQFYSTKNSFNRMIKSAKLGFSNFTKVSMSNYAIWRGTRLDKKIYKTEDYLV
jgi:radical SAM superfamily enzyme YgiQ (UPF0313 family)